MARYIFAISNLDVEQPAENYGCKCPNCRARWKKRLEFQHKLVVDLCTQRDDISAGDLWPATVAICNMLDEKGTSYDGITFSEMEIHMPKQVEENPEVIHGSPSGVTLQ